MLLDYYVFLRLCKLPLYFVLLSFLYLFLDHRLFYCHFKSRSALESQLENHWLNFDFKIKNGITYTFLAREDWTARIL